MATKAKSKSKAPANRAKRPAPKAPAGLRIEIKHRYTGAVLFKHTAPGNTYKQTVEAAVKAGANLAGAYLARANLDGANLAGANLARANLDGANLDGANLARANLARANLDGANLDGAKICEGCTLVGTGRDSILTLHFAHGWPLHLIRHSQGLDVWCGCKRFAGVEAARAHWQAHGDPQRRAIVLPALDLLLAQARIQGWPVDSVKAEAA